MLKIYGYTSFNPFKIVAVAEELGLDYEYEFVDLGRRANDEPGYAGKHPFNKVPVLEHDGSFVTESASICRYLARISDNRLYSPNPLQAADIDTVIDMMNIHIGRWMANFFWEEIICPKFFEREANPEVIKEASGWLEKQLPVIEKRLSTTRFLCGDEISIADPFALAYFMIHEQTSIDLSPYPAIQRWYGEMMARPAIVKANQVVFAQ